MCEAIILSFCLIGSFLMGFIVGALAAYKDSPEIDNIVELKDGKKIQMWKSFANNEDTFVACNMDKNNDYFDGDCVVFDKYGRINYINTPEISWSRREE